MVSAGNGSLSTVAPPLGSMAAMVKERLSACAAPVRAARLAATIPATNVLNGCCNIVCTSVAGVHPQRRTCRTAARIDPSLFEGMRHRHVTAPRLLPVVLHMRIDGGFVKIAAPPVPRPTAL